MKKFLLCLLLLSVPFATFADMTRKYDNVTKDITMTVGETITVNPLSEIGILTFGGLGCGTSASYTVSDDKAFTITSSKQTTSHSPYNINGSTNGYYYIYNLKALKAGNYTFVGKVGYISSTGSYGYFGVSTASATYNITVVEVTKISIPSAISVEIGKTYTFSPKITDSRAKTTLTWKSSNTSIATITSAGVLTAKGVGTATITCTASNGISAKCVVTVTPILATKVTLNYTSYQLEKNGKIKLVATVTPSNATNKEVTWKSSNASIASVAFDGTVTGLKAGTCNITATTADGSNKSATCKITVLKQNMLTVSAASICQGGQGGLAIQMINEDVIAGLQFDLTLPTGFSVVGKSLYERGVNHTISSNKLPDADNTWRFVILSTSGDKITGNSGTLANITLQADDAMALGDYKATVNNIILTKADGTKINSKNIQGTLHVIKPTMGDVNNDGDVDIADAIAVVNHILKKEATVFVNTAADMNGDGVIDIGDAIAIVNVILKK